MPVPEPSLKHVMYLKELCHIAYIETDWIALSRTGIPAYNDSALKIAETSNDTNRSPPGFSHSYFKFDRIQSVISLLNTGG
jgi:hypothetical protein